MTYKAQVRVDHRGRFARGDGTGATPSAALTAACTDAARKWAKVVVSHDGHQQVVVSGWVERGSHNERAELTLLPGTTRASTTHASNMAAVHVRQLYKLALKVRTMKKGR